MNEIVLLAPPLTQYIGENTDALLPDGQFWRVNVIAVEGMDLLVKRASSGDENIYHVQAAKTNFLFYTPHAIIKAAIAQKP